jgi:hypothetical protein
LTVTVASWLLILLPGGWVVFVAIRMMSAAVRSLVASAGAATQLQLGFSVIAAASLIVFALFMLRGAGWARVATLAVLGVFIASTVLWLRATAAPIPVYILAVSIECGVWLLLHGFLSEPAVLSFFERDDDWLDRAFLE